MKYAMQCRCCEGKLRLARRVKLRHWRAFDPALAVSSPAAYQSYREEMTYRWAVICEDCYTVLDNALGAGRVGGHTFNIAAASRRGNASVIDERKYRQWQRREAKTLGLDIDDDGSK